MYATLIFCFQLLTSINPPNSLPISHIGNQVEPESKILYAIVGSDWCPECRRLESTVLEDSTFINTLAELEIELIIVDFPQRKKLDKTTIKRNKKIADKYGFQGVFPTLILSKNEQFKQLFYKNETPITFTKNLINELDQFKE